MLILSFLLSLLRIASTIVALLPHLVPCQQQRRPNNIDNDQIPKNQAQSNLRRGEDLIQIAHGVVHDEAEDAHLRGPALVELDGALLVLPLVGLLVPAKVEAVAPVAAELGGAGAVGVADFEDGAGTKDPKVVVEGHVP